MAYDLSSFKLGAGETSSSTKFNNTVQAVQDDLNDLRTAVDAIAPSSGVPAGVVAPYAGAAAPSGWLLVDGSAVSRTLYSTLFAAIGTTYGAGDGSSTFNLPNMQNRHPMGKGSGTFAALGATGGAETHTIANAELPLTSTAAQSGGGANGITGQVAASFSLMNPYLVLNYIIKT